MSRSEEYITKTSQVVSPVVYRYTKTVIEGGQGSYLFDVDGNRFLDFAAGICTCPVGHAHPEVVAAIHGQAQKILHVCDHVAYYPQYTDFMDEIRDIFPGELKNGKGIFLNSGSEAVDGALKLARFISRRPYVISFIGAFHGRTMGAAAATASAATYKKNLSGHFPAVHHAPYPYCYRCPLGHRDSSTCNTACVNYLELMLEKIVPSGDLAAIIVEPIMGEGGYVVPPKDFLKKLRAICDRTGALLICDEIQSGVGRTGKWFGFEHSDVIPDVVTLAKAIGGGLPLGVVYGKEEIMDKWEPATHGSTFGGNPVSCAAGRTTLKILKRENIMENAVAVGKLIMDRLNEARKTLPAIGDIRGLGCMIGVELITPDGSLNTDLLGKVLNYAADNSLILTKCGPNIVRISPPLNLTREQAETGVKIIIEGIAKLS